LNRPRRQSRDTDVGADGWPDAYVFDGRHLSPPPGARCCFARWLLRNFARRRRPGGGVVVGGGMTIGRWNRPPVAPIRR